MLASLSTEQMAMPINKEQQLNGKCLDTSLNESHQLASSKSSSPTSSAQNSPRRSKSGSFKQRRHSNNIDHTLMGGFFEASMSKLQEILPTWQENWQQKTEPTIISQKQVVFEFIRRFVTENKEPVILLPNFDFNDVLNFERFLQALKVDGINAISKYKQYLSNKDMKKMDLDLAVIHAKYGILLFEVRECDHLDSKRRGKAKSQLNSARACLENLVKLIVDAKGLSHEHTLPVTEFIVLPNMYERPVQTSSTNAVRQPANPKAALNASLKAVNYIIKQDLENNESFAKWWSQYVVERLQQKQVADLTVMNYFMAVINGVRHNTVLPIVHQDVKPHDLDMKKVTLDGEKSTNDQPENSLRICAEFFHEAHEKVRALSKCVISSKDLDRVRRTTCIQTLWLLLNDPQKKLSVVCSEKNKPYYEEFFSRQKKLYNNLNNIRFYTDLKSCPVGDSNSTLKKENETWFFECTSDEITKDVVERIEKLKSFWVFTTGEISADRKAELAKLEVRHVDLDLVNQNQPHDLIDRKPWLSGLHLKFPLRLSCDLLVIGDMVSQAQMKAFQSYFKTVVPQQTHQQNGHKGHNDSKNSTSLAAKKLRSIKFIRGGSIENLRQSLKMHDSIQAQFVLLHVGDEDVFKTRNSEKTVDRIKELANTIKEMCPKSYVVLSTLMRRASKSENIVTNEVNKGIISFCKQNRESSSFFYMLNNHFDPQYHSYEGRSLNNKGLKLYVENIIFVVDYFLVKNNATKQQGNQKKEQPQQQQPQPQPQQQN